MSLISSPPIRTRAAFTIIEVMIVLVVAAAILLIVFLAVPALQRNSRNTQYRNEAQRIVALAEEFAAANGNQYPCYDAGNSRCNPSGSNAASWSDFLTNYLAPNGLNHQSSSRPYYAYRQAYNSETSDYFLSGGGNATPVGTILYWVGASCTSDNKLDPTLNNNPYNIAVWVKVDSNTGFCYTNAPR